MKSSIKNFAVVLFIATAMAVPAAGQNLTVGTYNIRCLSDKDVKQGDGWEVRSPWLCGIIKFERPDIFGAQEVTHPQLQDMLSMLDGYSYAGVARTDGKQAGEYSPVFYNTARFKLLEDGTFWLSETPDVPSKGWDAMFERICTYVHLKDKITRKKLWFFNLHMDHIGVTARREGAKLVVRKIQELCAKGEKVFLTGDFNVDQTNEIYAIFTGSGVLEDSFITAETVYAPDGTVNSFDPSSFSTSRLDHIFVSPGTKVAAYGVLTETYRTPIENAEQTKSGNFPKEVTFTRYRARTPSDHFPVFIKLYL